MLKIMSKFSATLVIMFLITLSPIFQYQASAHATLEKSTPQQQGIIKHKPEVIKLEFNEPVNTKYSSVTLFDDKGKRLKTLNQSQLDGHRQSYFHLIKLLMGRIQLNGIRYLRMDMKLEIRLNFQLEK